VNFYSFPCSLLIDENPQLDKIAERFDKDVECLSFSRSSIWLALCGREPRVISLDHES
jgi:hypothetical protein